MSISCTTLLFIPTYNEADNVKRILSKILELGLDIHILFLDDNSPDGTGAIISKLAKKHEGVFALHRQAKLGIGSAHKDGITWAYDNGYEIIVTMDCDFTHCPSYIPEFVKCAHFSEVTVGSRYLLSGSLKEWNIFRKFLTRLGHFLTRKLLLLPYDATGAFRSYRLDRIPRELFHQVGSNGYSFFFESLLLLHLGKFRIKEIPLHLFGRAYGHSKMRINDALQSLLRLFKLFSLALYHKKSTYVTTPISKETKQSIQTIQREWDNYWKRSRSVLSICYGFLAFLYRSLFIRQNLTFYIHKHFKSGSALCHAGCGSGQTDICLHKDYEILGMDISRKALEKYGMTNANHERMLQASILNIPIKETCFDGVFSLGLVEHFTPEDIQRLFRETYRILSPGGKMVLFWPPQFGLSVKVLRFAHNILNKISHKEIRLHPHEISLLKSRNQAKLLVEKAGFKMIDYAFGPRDLFVQSVIVAEKNINR